MKEDNSTQAMKSDQWVTNNQMKMAGCKHVLDRAKNKADSAEKTMETEIMKSLGKLEFDKFNPSKNGLVWLAHLFSTTREKEHLLTSRHSAPGFTKMLIGCLSGDDLERAKLYNTDPGAITDDLRRTYISSGLGMSLTHQQTLTPLTTSPW